MGCKAAIAIVREELRDEAAAPNVSQPVRLAKVGDYTVVIRALVDTLGSQPTIETMTDLIGPYELKAIPGKNDSTPGDQCRELKSLCLTFSHMNSRTLREAHTIQSHNE